MQTNKEQNVVCVRSILTHLLSHGRKRLYAMHETRTHTCTPLALSLFRSLSLSLSLSLSVRVTGWPPNMPKYTTYHAGYYREGNLA